MKNVPQQKIEEAQLLIRAAEELRRLQIRNHQLSRELTIYDNMVELFQAGRGGTMCASDNDTTAHRLEKMGAELEFQYMQQGPGDTVVKA